LRRRNALVRGMFKKPIKNRGHINLRTPLVCRSLTRFDVNHQMERVAA
jgi:hypothetical protein